MSGSRRAEIPPLDLEQLERPTLAATLRYVMLTGLFVVGLADLQG